MKPYIHGHVYVSRPEHYCTLITFLHELTVVCDVILKKGARNLKVLQLAACSALIRLPVLQLQQNKISSVTES